MKNKKLFRLFTILGLSITTTLISCSDNQSEQKTDPTAIEATSSTEEETPAETDPLKNKGIGPVATVEVGALNEDMVKKGQAIFESKCAACHKFDVKYVGPALQGVTTRRTPEWIMNMILNPAEMTQKDPIAKQLLEEHLTQMTFQDVTQEEARMILEYFRSVDEKAK